MKFPVVLLIAFWISLLACEAARSSSFMAMAEQVAFETSVNSFERGEYEESRRVLRELTTARPRSALYWYNLGNACLMLGRYREATVAYSRVDELGGPLAMPAKMYRVRAHFLMGNPERAKQLLAQFRPENLSEEVAVWVKEESAGDQVTPPEAFVHSDVTQSWFGISQGAGSGPWSAVLDGSVGASREPGYQLSAAASLLVPAKERMFLRFGARVAWLEGYTSDSSSLVTSVANLTLTWQPADGSPFLLSAEPYLTHRMADLRPILLSPGARVGAQYRGERDWFGAEYSAERVTATAVEFRPWEGDIHQLRAYWSAHDRTPEWRLGLLGRWDTATTQSTIGPEAYANLRLDSVWDLEFYGGVAFGPVPAVLETGVRANWLARSELVLHGELSGSAGGGTGSYWMVGGGATWSVL